MRKKRALRMFYTLRSPLRTRRFQPRADPVIRPLAPLLCPSAAVFKPYGRAGLRHQNHLHRPRVNAVGFFGSRCLPSTSALSPLSRREPATILTALPPRAGFQRFFAPSPAFAFGRARPFTVVTGYSPVIVRTTRCLSISAIVTIREHNRSIDRTPLVIKFPRS